MGFFDKLFGRTPDAVVPVTSNVNNEIYLNANDLDSYSLYSSLTNFISKEFTKVKITMDTEIPNSSRLDYMLNIKPNSTDTANDLLYTFGNSMIKNGIVYYKVSSNDRAITSIYFSAVQKPGYKKYEKKYLRIRRPRSLLAKYANLLDTLSTSHNNNLIELKTTLNADDKIAAQEVKDKLSNLNNEIHDHGMFLTQKGETATDHTNIQTPDGTALADLRSLILEEYNINEDILTGKYDEAGYRAFFATHIQPLANALEELLNYELLSYDSYTKGYRINVILDLLQFATLQSFVTLAQQGMYNGYLDADEIRRSLGKEPLVNGYGKILYTNANAKRINNPDGTPYVAPTTNTNSDGEDKNSVGNSKDINS